MIARQVLVDTGPIVAILSANDANHSECVQELSCLAPPLFTCWPVITEAHWLLRRQPRGVDGLFRAFSAGLLELAPLGADALDWIAGFLKKYRKSGAQLADAALVYLAERDNIETIFTLDRRDFSIFRFRRNRPFTILPNPG